LLGADFSYADLRRADLEATEANGATFASALLSRVNLARGRLQQANFSEADLTRASLFQSDLTGANFSRAQISQTDLLDAILVDAVLTGVRGEPFFDGANNAEDSAIGLAGWPAVRMSEQDLFEILVSHLSSLGWGVSVPASSEDPVVDVIARRQDAWLIGEVKATVALSPGAFAQISKRLRRVAERFKAASIVLVLPGPIPEHLHALAQAENVQLLSIDLDANSAWVDFAGERAQVEKPRRPAAVVTVCDGPHDEEVEAMETVRFAFNGRDYEIDLCSSHAAEMREFLSPLVEKARVSSKRQRSQSGKASKSRGRGGGSARKQSARDPGISPQAGRVPAAVIYEDQSD
jgi:uncharacterized protein YjbI with pentapeptide repeats